MTFGRAPHWWTLLKITWRFLLRSPLEVRLLHAAKRGHVARLESLLATSAWPLESHLTPTPTSYRQHLYRAHTGRTLLHAAAQRGHVEIVECLLARGANPEAYTDWGWRVTHMAAVYGHPVVLSLLAQRGAAINHQLPSSSTFWEEHYVGPTAIELVQEATGKLYEGNEYQAYRARLLGQSLSALEHTPVQVPGRPRF